MIPIMKKDYEDEDGIAGEIRIGWASWDEGQYKAKSIKWAYKDKTGKISRGSPEVPFDVLVEMVLFALKNGELRKEQVTDLQKALQRYG